MKPRSSTREYARTKYIQLDTRKCKACWKCLDSCPNNVIGRINLPFHKHARIINSINCKGCLKCLNVCESNALSKVSTT
jgi:2-oxoglutarate ferredoxin oxidoreductase subunit delta